MHPEILDSDKMFRCVPFWAVEWGLFWDVPAIRFLCNECKVISADTGRQDKRSNYYPGDLRDPQVLFPSAVFCSHNRGYIYVTHTQLPTFPSTPEASS